MPYISLSIKKNSKESLTTLSCTVFVSLYMYLTEDCRCHDDTVTNSHKQELGSLVYRSVQNTKSQVHQNDHT